MVQIRHMMGDKLADKNNHSSGQDEFIDLVEDFENNGLKVRDEPLWKARITALAGKLPEEVITQLTTRLRAARVAERADIARFAQTFHLTVAETALLISLANGYSVPKHSRDNGISGNTGRVHMQRILEKTGANGQLGLIHMLHNS